MNVYHLIPRALTSLNYGNLKNGGDNCREKYNNPFL